MQTSKCLAKLLPAEAASVISEPSGAIKEQISLEMKGGSAVTGVQGL